MRARARFAAGGSRSGGRGFGAQKPGLSATVVNLSVSPATVSAAEHEKAIAGNDPRKPVEKID
jgi:hypothetical protein